MRAARFHHKAVTLADSPMPEPRPGDALVRVAMAGVCNTDVELLQGYYGFSGIAGHEFTGVVEECPDRPKLKGRRVVADINFGCGSCPPCRLGDFRHCPTRTVLGIVAHDGCFADYVSVPATNLHVVPPELPDEVAVFAEPLAAALEIAQQVHLTGSMRVAVLGDGKLGLLCALALNHFGPDLVLAGRHEHKLALAEAKDIPTFLLEQDAGPMDLREGLGLFDLVVEATGRPGGLAHAMALARPEGTIVAKTTSREPSPLDLAALVVDEVTLMGSRCGDIALALKFLQRKRLDPIPLIEAVYPFEEFPKAMEHAIRPGALKVLTKF